MDDDARAARSPRPLRILLLVMGWIFVGLGVVGLILPLMPGVVFFIAAAACFARSSPRFERWLLDHPALGPPVRSWRRGGAIPRRAKVAACLGMGASWTLIALSGAPGFVKVGMAVVLLASGAYVVTRPEAPAL